MTIYVGITDIIPNAFINIMQKSKDYKQGDTLEIETNILYKYALHIADLVGKAEGEDRVVLTYNRDDEELFVKTFGDTFYKTQRNGVSVIGVYPEVKCFDLREQFRGGLTISLAKALSNKSALADLGIGGQDDE